MQSSGDSVDDTDLSSPKSSTCREVIDADNPQTPEEVHLINYVKCKG